MPFSIATFYAMRSVINNNLIERMTIMKSFFKIRLIGLNLFILDQSRNKFSLSLSNQSFEDIFVSIR